MKEFDFYQSSFDNCLFIKFADNKALIVYIENTLFTGINKVPITSTQKFINI